MGKWWNVGKRQRVKSLSTQRLRSAVRRINTSADIEPEPLFFTAPGSSVAFGPLDASGKPIILRLNKDR